METLVVGAIETNCYLVPLETGGALVIDPGDNAGLITGRLEQLKLVPRYIIITHGHYDHLAALPAIVRHYASQPPLVAIHQDDRQYLGGGSYEEHCRCFAAATGGDTSFVDALWEELPAADKLLCDNDTIEQFTVLHVPGHSAGSIALYDAQAGILFSGDTLFSGGFGRTDLPGSNSSKLEQSIKRLFKLPPQTRVFCGHGSPTTIGNESGLV